MKGAVRGKAVLISLVILLGSFLLITWSESLSGYWKPTVSSIGTTLFAIGLLSLIYDVVMRRELQEELLELVDAERTSAACRLRSMQGFGDFDWGDQIGRATKIRMLLCHPEPVLTILLPRMLEACGKRPVELEIIIPSATSQHVASMAAFHRLTPTEFADSLRRAGAVVEDSWRTRLAALVKGSSLSLKRADQVFTASLVHVDQELVLITYQPCGSSAAGLHDPLLTTFDASQGVFPGAWLLDDFEAVRSASTRIYDNIRK